MRVCMMCHGKQHRLDGVLSVPKQMLALHGETVIERTARIAGARGEYMTLVAPSNEVWFQAANVMGVHEHISLAEQPRNLVDALEKARVFEWADDVVILLGDVVYSNACLDALMTRGGETRFVGRTSGNPFTGKTYAELYGLYVPKWRLAAMHALAERLADNGAGLWQMYYAVAGVKGPIGSQYLRAVNDWTDDVDTREDFVDRFAKLVEFARYDDPPAASDTLQTPTYQNELR